MNSNKINRTVSCPMNSVIRKYITIDKDKNIAESSTAEIYKDTDDSVISKDAVLEYKFLSRIQASDEDVNMDPHI